MAAKRTTTWAVVVGGLLVALGLAFFVSRFASSSPDGLNKVAIDQGFDDTQTNHATADGPFAGYGVKGVDDQGLSTGLAGIVGVAVTFGIGLRALRRRRSPQGDGRRARCRGGHRLVRLRTVTWRPRALRPRRQPDPPAPAGVQVAGPDRCSCSPSSPRPARRSGRSASYAADAGGAHPARRSRCGLRRPAPGDRGAVRAVRGVPAVRRPGASGSRCSACRCRSTGLWAAWNILVKGTLGVAASVLLAATTPSPDPAAGSNACTCRRCSPPITGFMIRYLEVITRRAAAMRVARESRGYDAALALAGAGRSRPRPARCSSARTSAGERVHLAMVSRGYDGSHARRRRGGARHGRTGRAATRRCRPRRPWSACSRWTLRPMSDAPVPRGRAASPSPTPTATRRCSASTSRSRAASGSRCSARTAPARPRSCCTSTASSPPGTARCRSAACRSRRRTLQEIRRRVGIVFQDPDDQLFMPTVRDDVALRPGQLRRARRRARRARRRALAAVGHGGVRRPDPAPPQLRAAPARGGRHRAGDGPGDPGARRALVEPRPRRPARARRHPALAGRHHADGHPRPALRAGAVPALGGHDDGAIVADGPTGDLLADEELMAANRLELPFGFFPERAFDD